MEIIEYRGYDDIDVKFSDSSIRSGIEYGSFKKGRVMKR